MWKWIRIPKGIALVAFLLPWMTVSCSNQKVAEASGFGLAFGRISAMGQAAQASDGAAMNFWLILSLLAIAGGLFLLFTRGREAAKLVLGTSAAAFVLILIGTWRYSKDAILAEAAKSGGGSGGDLDRAALSLIQIDWHFGYWLALLALIASGVMAWLVMSGKEEEAEAKMRALAAEATEKAKVAAAKASEAAKEAATKANEAIEASKDKKDGDPPKG